MNSRGKDLDKLAKDLEKLEDQSRVDQEAHVSAQKQYQAVTAGLSSNDDGQAATLNDQLMSKYSLLAWLTVFNLGFGDRCSTGLSVLKDWCHLEIKGAFTLIK